MKKINKNRTVTQGIRLGAEFISDVGAGIAVESALMPFVAMLWKSKPVRAAGYFGSFALACGAGAFAARTMDDVLDVFIDFYNSISDAVNGKSSDQTDFDLVKEIPADKITTGTISKEQFEVINNASDPLVDAVANSKVFEFKSEMMAQSCIHETNALWKSPSIFDFAVTRSKFDISWAEKYFNKIKDVDEAKIYGWPHGLVGAEIEKVNDDLYFVDLLDYEIVQEKVNYYKDSDMNHMVPKED